MKQRVWKNKSNNQLCITIPKNSAIKEGDIVQIQKDKIKSISYSYVVGDLFHYGHLHSIRFASSFSDYNIVGVLTDEVVEKYRVRPVSNHQERKEVIGSLNCVDRVMVQRDIDPTDNLKKIHEEFPNAEIKLVHGSDWKKIPGSEYIKSIGGKVVKHPYYDKLSNFKIIKYIVENKDKFKDISYFSSIIGTDKKGEEFNKLNKMIISTKADSLARLKNLLTRSKIEDMYVFSVSDWRNNKKKIIGDVFNKFNKKIVVRSSALIEDGLNSSMAGFFDSVINVDSNNEKEIESAINRVIKSYKKDNYESSFNQVLVQSQTEDIIMSGVLFTRSLNENSPYYVINYDDLTSESDSVTKGVAGKTIKISHFADFNNVDERIRRLLDSVKEIENLISGIGLDIEFAINSKDEVIIFQVRPLTTSVNGEKKDSMVKEKINFLKQRFSELSLRKSNLAGDSTIFADMPDWNPAEIIGDCPNYLDYSLYDYIITDSAWSEARETQGYYDVYPSKLVFLFGNKPYIDVRASFNSFVPKSINNKLREKLVSFYLKKLKENASLQDKVEFEIVYSCYDLGFDDSSRELLSEGFDFEEVKRLKESLIDLTNSFFSDYNIKIKNDLDSIKEMEAEREDIIKEVEGLKIPVINLLKKAKFLLDDCRKKGTVQFSRLARLAFVGKILMKSIVKKDFLSESEYNDFMNSIKTVASEISDDFNLLLSGRILKEDFLKKYSHLRPGTYDITSLRYSTMPNLIECKNDDLKVEKNKEFFLSSERQEEIDIALKNEGLNFSCLDLFDFIRKSLEAREYAKFEFTKNLSEAIEIIAKAGDELGFTRQELSFLGVKDLFYPTKDNEELIKKWKEIISYKIKEREINNKIFLPPIIFSEDDFEVVKYYSSKPNFISNKKIQAQIAFLKEKNSIPDIEGKIVFIENGDPGYDWIFTRNIAGLITKYGGVASHMSIRCAEFGIPAAIGCGEIFDNLIDSNFIILDCLSKKITPLKNNLEY